MSYNTPDQNTYDWIKEKPLTPFSADLRRFPKMLNKSLKNYNQSINFTLRNISMNETNNDLNIYLNDSKNSLNEDDSILNQSISQRPPAETTRSKRPISDQTYREITELAKKKKKVNEIREYNSRPKKRKPFQNIGDDSFLALNFKIGDKVRISKNKGLFEKGYTSNWTREIFLIDKIVYSNPPTYIINDLNDETIEGRFYDQELQ
ncbi:unnamed protein product [Brachionus calyciflorus]|uniref:Chromo domain-containing protein n=1 Tax=Brachionus calyciflorus TaxID=104777 RepID=A0A814ALG7_9BILA|nr:unnamed protein product [Brachionus calyciflorus]